MVSPEKARLRLKSFTLLKRGLRIRAGNLVQIYGEIEHRGRL